MCEPQNHDLKTIFISLGAAGKRAKARIQSVFDGLMREVESIHSSRHASTPEDQSQPMLTTAGGKSFLQTPSRYLRDADLVYLCGTSEGDDFPNARRAILQAMGKSFLFTFPVGPGPAIQPVSDQECVIHIQGTNPMEAIACFVRDFTFWNMFPHTISCDWADIKTCLGGKEKTLAVYCSHSHDYEKGFMEFLTQHRFELARSSSVLLHCGWERPDVPWGELFWPMEMLEGYVRKGVPMVYLESTKTGLDTAFRAFLIL